MLKALDFSSVNEGLSPVVKPPSSAILGGSAAEPKRTVFAKIFFNGETVACCNFCYFVEIHNMQ